MGANQHDVMRGGEEAQRMLELAEGNSPALVLINHGPTIDIL